MSNALKHYQLYSKEYVGPSYFKKVIKLPKNSKILSLHENIFNGIPCPGFGISVLVDTKIKDFKEYEFLIFPICISKTECSCIDEYTFLGTFNVNTSYYDVFYKII